MSVLVLSGRTSASFQVLAPRLIFFLDNGTNFEPLPSTDHTQVIVRIQTKAISLKQSSKNKFSPTRWRALHIVFGAMHPLSVEFFFDGWHKQRDDKYNSLVLTRAIFFYWCYNLQRLQPQ